jgi:uncharacterized membrane protein
MMQSLLPTRAPRAPRAPQPRRSRRDRRDRRCRASRSLITGIILANVSSMVWLVRCLVRGTAQGHQPNRLLLYGAGIWLVNLIGFALWYRNLDSRGPQAHFQFPQPSDDWGPAFADYLYLSFTNSTAFSPTDALPLSRPAKLTMMFQAVISWVTLALVIARAVNILT